jgi:signal transduction histidine kinase
MNPHASLYAGFAAIQLFTAISFGLLARRTRTPAPQASFGWVAAMLGVTSVLHFFELSATSAHASSFWQSLVLASHFLTLLAFTWFARAYLGLEDVGQSMKITHAIVALAMLPVLAGFAFDPSRILVVPSALAPGPERPMAEMTPAGLACALFGFVAYGIAWSPGVKKLMRVPMGRELPLVMTVTSVAYTVDFIHYALDLRAVPLAPVACLFFSLSLSALILARYMDVRSALERHTSELRHRYDQIALIETEIDKREPLAIVGELSGVIARQIQEPIATLREATADLRIESLSMADREQALGLLDRETNKLNRLISDLLTYARPVEPQLERLAARSIWEDAIERLERETGRRLDVELHIEDDVSIMEGDSRLLSHAALLLVENAASVLSDDDCLSIDARRYDEGGRSFVRLEIRDTAGWVNAMARSSLGSGRRLSSNGGSSILELGIIDKIITAHGGSFLFTKNADGTLVGVALFPLRSTSSETT